MKKINFLTLSLLTFSALAAAPSVESINHNDVNDLIKEGYSISVTLNQDFSIKSNENAIEVNSECKILLNHAAANPRRLVAKGKEYVVAKVEPSSIVTNWHSFVEVIDPIIKRIRVPFIASSINDMNEACGGKLQFRAILDPKNVELVQ